MKKKSFKFLAQMFLALGILSVVAVSCKEKDPIDDTPTTVDPIAAFRFEIDATDFLKVTFKNDSKNATAYSWNFGDESAASTETDPIHTYAAAGKYTVTLSATNADNVTKTKTAEITITDPLAALRILTGDNGKIWKLNRNDKSMYLDPYWTDGAMNNGSRPCIYNQTWKFNPDGTFVFDDGGAFWAEYGIFNNSISGCADNVTAEGCIDALPANMVNACNADVSAWLSGTHNFEYSAATGKLKVSGLGAWLGNPKVTDAGDKDVPQSLVTYNVAFTEEATYDLMQLTIVGDGFTWYFNYISYDNPADEPAVVSFKVDFALAIDGFAVTFENKSQDAASYSWDFGDGSTSTEANPVHTYAAEGSYKVVLTGTSNGGETKTAEKNVSISLNPTVKAPTPTVAAANVISIYSDAYTDVAGVNINPNWGQATITSEIDIEAEKAIKMAGLNYQGIDWSGTPQDVSGKTKIHVDVYCVAVTDVNLSVIGGGAENAVKLTTEAGVWKSFDIDLTQYTSPKLSEVIQVKFDDAGTAAGATIFVDNIYFY